MPLARKNLKDDVASLIRELVFSAELRPGMRIDQDGIAAGLGISKLPVREALIVLDAEGLVENYPSKGAFVARLSQDDIFDSYEAVGHISGMAAARAAKRMGDDEIAQLHGLYEKLVAAHNGEVVPDAEQVHHDFHRIVHRAGGSRRLKSVLRSLTNAIPEHLHFVSRGSTEHVLGEHREILEALEGRSPERAATAALAHFINGAEHAVALLAERGFWTPDRS